MSHQSLVTLVGAHSKSLLVILDFTRVVTLQITHIQVEVRWDVLVAELPGFGNM